MERLASALCDFLGDAMARRLSRRPGGRIQPVLVGPPRAALSALFDRLTEGGTADWTCPVLGSERQVVVLLVDPDATNANVSQSTLSQPCTWDYAVSIRNSVDVSVTLVAPAAWDSRHESIANATETIGQSRPLRESDLLSSDPWPFLIQAIAARTTTSVPAVRDALGNTFRQSRGLEARLRDAALWDVTEDLLGCTDQAGFASALGVPALGGQPATTDVLRLATSTLNDFATFAEKVGFYEAERSIRAAAAAILVDDRRRGDRSMAPLARPLRGLFEHLRETAGSASTFGRCAAWYYRPLPGEIWWEALPQWKLRRLLDELGASKPSGRLTLACPNALNIDVLEDEPIVVREVAEFQVGSNSGPVPPQVAISRRIPGQPLVALTAGADGSALDDDIPDHEKAVKYKAESPTFSPATLNIISLASFGCGGHGRIVDALSNPPPSRRTRQSAFEQEISVPRAGVYDFLVYGAPGTSMISVNAPQGSSELLGESGAIPIEIEDRDEWQVALKNDAGDTLSEWTVRVLVQEPAADAPRTRFEALVRAHHDARAKPRPVHPTDSYVRRIEEAYLVSSESWRSVLACFSSGTMDGPGEIVWETATLGDLPVPDVRPPFATARPPQSYLSARDDVRHAILDRRRTLAEVSLADPSIMRLLERYLVEYLGWLAAQPEAASWSDCIGIHAPLRNVQAGQEIAASEPAALLLSPLHPIRLAWHARAQAVLQEALSSKPCPAAGLLDPHASPSVVALPIYRGGALLLWRAYLATACNEAHWQLLWSTEYLGQSQERDVLLRALDLLGFSPSGLTGGFSRAQARRALEDVAGILPARAALRVGLVGNNEESRACVDGLVEWCRLHLGEEEGSPTNRLPSAGDVVDFRDQPRYPSAATLAILSEETGERVRWFATGPAAQTTQMDLVLLDQVGALQPRSVAASTRAPVARDALFRVNLRQDIGQALVLQEARVGVQERADAGFAGALLQATLATESLSASKAQATHLQFEPNQQALGQRLDRSLFVAATSGQIDPACFIRGARAVESYLWDYELPGTPGYGVSRAGYYLVAKPTESMKEAIVRTMQLVTSAPPPVESLLDEISKRGIPVLKRMARGGGQARGELGVLLAVRLLQDAFRGSAGPQRLPVVEGNCVHLLLPVDSYWNPFAQLRRSLDSGSSEERPDLLVLAFARSVDGRTRIKVTPVEIKLRETSLPVLEIGQALHQAANLGGLLEQLWARPPENGLWSTCGRALLAQCIDHAFRVYADTSIHGQDPKQWAGLHQQVLQDVIGEEHLEEIVTVNADGRLLVFDRSSATEVVDMDGNGRLDTAVLNRADAEALLLGESTLSPRGEEAVGLLDFSFRHCGGSDTADSHVAQPTAFTGRVGAAPSGNVELQSEREEPHPTVDTGGGGQSEIAAEEAADATALGESEVGATIASPVPVEVRNAVRRALEGFVGNEPAVKRVSNDLLRALIERPPHLPRNYLLTGQPSTGKTELARRMASALGLPFVRLDGRGVVSRDRIYDLVDGELSQAGMTAAQVGHQAGLPVFQYPPLVVFIDEVHLVPRAIQESLLTMLEAADRTVTLGSRVARVERATFIFATTRASELDSAFRSRCAEVQLREYDLGEVAEIISRRFPGWTRDVYTEIAKLGRRVPRVALELARELETEITVSEHTHRSALEHLREVRTARELDEFGLTPLDLQCLSVLERENRPVGEQSLLNMLGNVDRDRIVDEVEPFLVRLGFIRLGARGREITPEGRAYVLERRRST